MPGRDAVRPAGDLRIGRRRFPAVGATIEGRPVIDRHGKNPAEAGFGHLVSVALQGLLPVGNGHAACGLSAVFAGCTAAAAAAAAFFAAGFFAAFFAAGFLAAAFFAAGLLGSGLLRRSLLGSGLLRRGLLRRRPSSPEPSSPAAFFAGAFLAAAFFAGAFFAAAFFAGAFFAATFLAGAFFAAAFLAGAFFAAAFFAGAFFAVAITFSLIKLKKSRHSLARSHCLTAIHRPKSAQEGRPGTMNRVANRGEPLLRRLNTVCRS